LGVGGPPRGWYWFISPSKNTPPRPAGGGGGGGGRGVGTLCAGHFLVEISAAGLEMGPKKNGGK
jgi:hypothetical protein